MRVEATERIGYQCPYCGWTSYDTAPSYYSPKCPKTGAGFV